MNSTKYYAVIMLNVTIQTWPCQLVNLCVSSCIFPRGLMLHKGSGIQLEKKKNDRIALV